MVFPESRIAIIKQVVGFNNNNRNRTADFTFSRNFSFLVPISRGGSNARFAPPPCGRPWRVQIINIQHEVHFEKQWSSRWTLKNTGNYATAAWFCVTCKRCSTKPLKYLSAFLIVSKHMFNVYHQNGLVVP